MTHWHLGAIWVGIVIAVAGPSPATALELTDEQVAAVAQAAMRPGITYEDVLAAVTRPVRTYDLGKNGLDEADLARARQARDARIRGPILAALLASDLDNNQRVTREEYEIAGRSNPLRSIVGLLGAGSAGGQDPFVVRDDDGDDILTWAEMSKIRPQDMRGTDPIFEVAAFLLDVDPTPDGFFNVSDARQVSDAAFAKLDENRDGGLDSEEVTRFSRLAARARVKAKIGPNAN